MTADDPRVQRAREALGPAEYAKMHGIAYDSGRLTTLLRDLLAAYDERSEQKSLAENHRIAANERAEAAEAEVKRLRAKLERVEDLADELTEQGNHHVPGCEGQADCARCVQLDLRKAINGEEVTE